MTRDLDEYGSFLTIAEAAHVLRIGRATAYEYARDGVLPVVRMGSRLIVPKTAIQKLADGVPCAAK